MKKPSRFSRNTKKINAFLDNDEAGKHALEKLQKLNLPIADISKKYADFKDLNTYLCRQKQADNLSVKPKRKGLKR
ncbi:toprim domain-containing protein [Porphyromonas pogonae]|uniref:toprim domain-containing protein n=1 Tax=Porphyromonas pogonae TaxID=867595 RepID=UPI002E794D28|nr:toprim domain-containing protein [Porphyromonas pogonae]